ncbi:MAG: hypothetical protein ACYC2H_09950 [Thermoplasmatota archaeon]
MERRTRSLLDQQLAWAASVKQKFTVPRDAYLAAALIRVAVTYDTGAAAAVAENGVLNAISRISLKASGKVKRSWTPSRYWYKLPLDIGVKPEFNNVTTTQANGKAASFELPIFFRLDVNDEDQLQYLMAAVHHTSLELEVEWAAAAALGTNQTITAATATLTLNEVILDPAEERVLYGVAGKHVLTSPGTRLLEILETEVEKTIDAAYADFKFGVDLPTGALLLRSFVTVIRNSLRDDTQVTHVRVRDTRGARKDFIEETFEQSQARDLREYNIPAPIEGVRFLTGFTVLDHMEYMRGGLDLRNVQDGAVKAQFTTIAPNGTTKLILLHEQVDKAGA